MGNVIRIFISLFLKAVGVLLIVVAWLGYFGIWEEISSFSLDFLHSSLPTAIGFTLGGVFILAFSGSIARLGR